MADLGYTEVTSVIQKVISEMVQKELKEKSVIAPTLKSVSNLVGPGMDRISFPSTGGFTAEDKTENTSLTSQVLTYSKTDLDLDQHKAILVRAEDRAILQARPDVEADIIQRMTSELALNIDSYLYTKLQAASAAAPDHRIAYANATTVQEEDILEARKLLNLQFASTERFLLISPAQEKNMLQIANFIQADRYPGNIAIANGELGRVYGFRVLVSSIVEDLKTVAYTPESVVWAMQQQVKYEKDRDLPNVASEHLMSTIYGAVEMQDGKQQVLLGTAT